MLLLENVQEIVQQRNEWRSFITTFATFYMNSNPRVAGNGWHLQYQRACTWGRFQSKIDSSVTVCLANSHFDVGGHKSQDSAALITSELRKQCDSTDLIFLTGDLNVAPSHPAIQILQGFPLVQSNHNLRERVVGFYLSDHAILESTFCTGTNCTCFQDNLPVPVPVPVPAPVPLLDYNHTVQKLFSSWISIFRVK